MPDIEKSAAYIKGLAKGRRQSRDYIRALESRIEELENPEGCEDYPAPCNCDEPCEVAR